MSSETPQDRKPPARRRARRLSAAALALVLLALLLGPNLLLNLSLARLVRPESGLALNYERARAGFLLGSARAEGLTLTETAAPDRPPLVSIRRLRLEGLSVGDLIKMLRGRIPPDHWSLAEEIELEGLRFDLGQGFLNLDQGRVRRLRLRPAAAPGQPPLTFDKLEARGFNLEAAPEKISFSRLEARDLGSEFLAGLNLRDFHYGLEPGPEQAETSVVFQLDALNLSGLRLEAVRRVAEAKTGGQAAWGVLAGCDSLDLVRGALSRAGRPALNLKSAVFDSVSRPTGAEGFVRRAEWELDLGALAGDSGDPFWADLREIFGDRFQGELALELDYQPRLARAELKSARLDLPDLARLELAGALTGVGPVKSHHSPSQLLLSTGGWTLEDLALDYQDRGLAANFYRHLDRTAFRGAPGRNSADNIMEYVIRPLAQNLEYEQGLDNLPALVSEVEAFLHRPRSLKISADPDPPLPLLPVVNSLTFMSLANQGKYDIIEKLRLTLAVNDRAPVFVAVASGVFTENLPRAPRPMEKAFDDEEIITEEDI